MHNVEKARRLKRGVRMLSSMVLNSQVAARRDNSIEDAVAGASRVGGRGGGGLSSDEGCSKGENGERGEAEHGGDGVGRSVTGCWMLDVGGGGGVSKSNAQGKTSRFLSAPTKTKRQWLLCLYCHASAMHFSPPIYVAINWTHKHYL